MWNLYEDGLTQSFILTFMCCRKKAYNVYVRGLRKKQEGISKILEFGSMFHDALDRFNSNPNRLDILQSSNLKSVLYTLVDKIEEEKVKEFFTASGNMDMDYMEKYGDLCAILRPTLYYYFHHWRKLHIETEWVSLERVFDNKFKSPFSGKEIRLRGKFDGELRRKSLWLFESKTKSNVDEQVLVHKLTFDFQTMFYMYNMFLLHGEYPAGVIYNVVKRVGIRRKQKETALEFAARAEKTILENVEEYYAKIEGTISHQVLTEWWENEFLSVLKDIEEWWANVETASYKNPVICNIYQQECHYLQLCSGSLTENFYNKTNRVFEELLPMHGD